MRFTKPHEINFVTHAFGTTTVYGYAAPAIGAVVQIKRVDFTVSAVFWTIDQKEGDDPSLRIIVELDHDQDK